MNTATTWAADVRRFLEHAPRSVPYVEGLRAWTGERGTICAQCAARLTVRGFGTLLVGMVSVWDDQPAPLGPCDGCGVRP